MITGWRHPRPRPRHPSFPRAARWIPATPGTCPRSSRPGTTGRPGFASSTRRSPATARTRATSGWARGLLQAWRDADALGQLAYRVWYYATLRCDQDQRDNDVNGRRQRVQLLIARWQQATSWFNPELLRIPWPPSRSGWRSRRTWRSTGSPSRTCSAGRRRARRPRRAAAVAVGPPRRDAVGRLCRAVDRRRAFRPSR